MKTKELISEFKIESLLAFWKEEEKKKKSWLSVWNKKIKIFLYFLFFNIKIKNW
jgi:hypothetical protein